MSSICTVPISVGELFDKYTILQIKSENIIDNEKLKFVHLELEYLRNYINAYNVTSSVVDELKKINEQLWDIEDKIRIKEKKGEFDSEFIELARSVYKTNDKRSDVKLKINILLNSTIKEIKSYA